jgi:transcriptional repressor NrdR
MNCPNCGSYQTFVINSRPTKEGFQIWRRRICENCQKRFTTHEIIDLSHLVVIKRSGKKERFSRIKLYSGILWATLGVKIPNRERVFDKITTGIEKEILSLKKKIITSAEIAKIVLKHLYQAHASVFLRFFSYHKNLQTKEEMKKELKKYLSDSKKLTMR